MTTLKHTTGLVVDKKIDLFKQYHDCACLGQNVEKALKMLEKNPMKGDFMCSSGDEVVRNIQERLAEGKIPLEEFRECYRLVCENSNVESGNCPHFKGLAASIPGMNRFMLYLDGLTEEPKVEEEVDKEETSTNLMDLFQQLEQSLARKRSLETILASIEGRKKPVDDNNNNKPEPEPIVNDLLFQLLMGAISGNSNSE